MSPKKRIRSAFDTVADNYDGDALWFFRAAAAGLPAYLTLTGNEHILDACTGTGAAALALAPHLPDGRVTGIDISPGMLARARTNAATQGARNVDFVRMDLDALTFSADVFDAANCSFGLFFVEDMAGALQGIARTVKPGGQILVCGFASRSFMPYNELLLARLERQGVARPALTYRRLDTEEKMEGLLDDAGLQRITTHRLDCDRYLASAHQWWDVVWNSGYRTLINQLDPDSAERFRLQHIEEIARYTSERGLYLPVTVIFGECRVPLRVAP